MSRYLKTSTGYVFDKYIFRGAALLVVVISIIAIAIYGLGGDGAYFTCPVDAPGGWCENPFYKEASVLSRTMPDEIYKNAFLNCDLYKCYAERVPAGVLIGEPTPELVSAFPLLVAVIVLVAFGINHFVSNAQYWREESY